MMRKLFCFVLLFIQAYSVRSQVSISYNQTYLRDIVTTDSAIFAVHFNPSQDTLDYTNTKDNLLLYKFDLNLNLLDSLVLDSLRIGKCIERNGNIFIAATRVYPDTFTCSLNLFHLNQNFDILNQREFKEMAVSFFASDFIFSNDSIRILIGEDRTKATGIQYSKEFVTDTAFVDLDSVSCGMPASPMVFYYKNAISFNHKRVYSGSLDYSNFYPPIYHIFSEDGVCSEITPFSLWFDQVYNETNFQLMRGHSNYLLMDNHSFFISIAGENDFGNFDSFTGVLKTDTMFNLLDYYFHQPTTVEENLVPFRNRSILHFEDKILLASNTKMHAWLANPPYEENEIRIDVVDTNFNFISGINLDPMPWINRPYYGNMLKILPDGGILLGGNFVPLTGSDPELTFLIKYSNLSELLGIEDKNDEWNSFTVYPNPANDWIRIISNPLFESAEVNFYDVTGKLINSKVFDENGFSVSDFSSGIYFIRIQTESGNFSGKFIKE